MYLKDVFVKLLFLWSTLFQIWKENMNNYVI